MRHSLKSLLVAASSVALVTTMAVAPAQAKSKPKDPEVVAAGLGFPLSLDLGRGHDLYVTQNGPGLLSKVTKRGGVETVASVTPPTQLGGVAYHNGATYHLEADFSGEMPTSYVVKIDKRGKRTVVSDNFWEHEMAANPDADRRYGFVGLSGSCREELEDFQAAFPPEVQGIPFLLEYTGIVESNAYQLTVAKNGTIYVADAAANAILKVNRRGDISTVAVLPASTVTFTTELEDYYEQLLEGSVPDTDVPDCVVGRKFTHEPVPTDVQIGHKGRLYVPTLQGGAGEVLPLSKVYRINPSSGSSEVVASGLHGTTGLAIAPNGHIFVAELFGGKVSVIRDGKVRTVFEANSPSDVAVKGSWLYATTGVFAESGEVVKYHYPKRR